MTVGFAFAFERFLRRARLSLMWGFSAVCGVIALLALVSLLFMVAWNPTSRVTLQLYSGGIEWRDYGSTGPALRTGLFVQFAFGPMTAASLGLPRIAGYYFDRIPLVPVALAAAVPAAVLWRFEIRRRRRGKVGLCVACGYDRRGLAEDAVCPECGKRV